MKEVNDEVMIKNIIEAMDSLESKIPVKTPDLGQFREMVNRIEEKKRSRQRKETYLFMLFAFTILAIEVFSFSKSPVFFIAVQISAVISIPLSLFIWYKHQCKQVGEV